MSFFRKSTSREVKRPSLIVSLKLEDKLGLPLDSSSAWLLIQEAFKDHPNLIVRQAEIQPDLKSSIIKEED